MRKRTCGRWIAYEKWQGELGDVLYSLLTLMSDFDIDAVNFIGYCVCFSTENIDLRLSEHVLEYSIFVPTLAIWQTDHLYEFEISSDLIKQDMGANIVDEWKALVEGEIEFCIKAAFLQSLEYDRSLWILKSIKTRHSYWDESKLK